MRWLACSANQSQACFSGVPSGSSTMPGTYYTIDAGAHSGFSPVEMQYLSVADIVRNRADVKSAMSSVLSHPKDLYIEAPPIEAPPIERRENRSSTRTCQRGVITDWQLPSRKLPRQVFEAVARI